MRRGAVVLCGGRSTRMGRDKAWLTIAGETMLERTVRIAKEAVAGGPVVVVAAAGQELPAVGPEITVSRDAAQGQGPLEGLRVGLPALAATVDAVFVSGCDAPLMTTAFIDFLFNTLGEADAAVPADDERLHPLTAVYRPAVLAQIDRLMNDGKRSLHALLEACNTNRVVSEQLRHADPQLRSLVNVNGPADYERVLRLLAEDAS